MPEYIRALVAILLLTIPTLFVLRGPISAASLDPRDYALRAWMWVLLTAFAFLAQGFWVFVIGATVLLVVTARFDSSVIGLYAFLLLAIPPFAADIPGFAGINKLIEINYLRFLSIVLLFPAMLKLLIDPNRPRVLKVPSDKYMLGYLALQLAITAPITTSTDLMRTSVQLLIDAWLPYYVCSRALVDERRIRDFFAAFTAACTVLAVIALFEAAKGWLLYSPLAGALGLRWGYGSYMFRDGALRAMASTGHSIYLGYVLTIALGFHFAVRRWYVSRRLWLCVALVIGAGIAATLARGPWVGTVVLLVVTAALAPNAKAAIAKWTIAAAIAVPAVMATPIGSMVFSYLPFVGKFDQGSVDYRQQLFFVSWDVFWLNPILGSPFYMQNSEMETMRQGEGIIDIVNSYLGIALGTGLVGLILFLGVFVASAGRVCLLVLHAADKFSEEYLTGRALLATTAGILVMIATVGGDNAVSVLYWSVAGACAAYAYRHSGAMLRLQAPSSSATERTRARAPL